MLVKYGIGLSNPSQAGKAALESGRHIDEKSKAL